MNVNGSLIMKSPLVMKSLRELNTRPVTFPFQWRKLLRVLDHLCLRPIFERWQRRSAWRCWSGFFHWVNLPSNWWWGSSDSLGDFVELFHFRPRWTTRRSSWCSTRGFSFDPSWHPSHTPSPATFRELEARTRVLHLRCNPPMQLRFRREREALSLEQPRTLQKRESGAGSSPW